MKLVSAEDFRAGIRWVYFTAKTQRLEGRKGSLVFGVFVSIVNLR